MYLDKQQISWGFYKTNALQWKHLGEVGGARVWHSTVLGPFLAVSIGQHTKEVGLAEVWCEARFNIWFPAPLLALLSLSTATLATLATASGTGLLSSA